MEEAVISSLYNFSRKRNLHLHSPMAHYDIYRDRLATAHPAFGHALWEPDPEVGHGAVEIGDVGYVREGKFNRLFNALLPASDASHEDRKSVV